MRAGGSLITFVNFLTPVLTLPIRSLSGAAETVKQEREISGDIDLGSRKRVVPSKKSRSNDPILRVKVGRSGSPRRWYSAPPAHRCSGTNVTIEGRARRWSIGSHLPGLPGATVQCYLLKVSVDVGSSFCGNDTK
jgi:hypothetical protein